MSGTAAPLAPCPPPSRPPPDSAAAGSGRLRPVVEADLPAIAALHRRAFDGAPSARTSAEELETLLREIVCGHPWPDRRLPSLVFEQDGAIAGFLGIMPRPMSFDGEPIVAAVGHNFMVDPDRRSSLAAIELVRGFLAGAQDLSLAEGTDTSRRVWKALGGTVAPAYSLRWTRPLAPARYGLGLLVRRGVPAWWLRPLAAAADFAAARLPASPLRDRRPDLEAADLDDAALADCIGRLSARRQLAPRYDAADLEWMLGVLDRHAAAGSLRGVALRRAGEIAGWYLWFMRSGRVAEAVQIGATEEAAVDVVDHLLADVRRAGAVAVAGRLEPALMPALSERMSLFHRGRGPSWLLAHSRDERLLRAVHAGDAFLTRLEGEWWA